jgi:MoxR-like ATPase
VSFVQSVRELHLSKAPGVAETLDWAEALVALGRQKLDPAAVEATLGCLSKSLEDTAKIRNADVEKLIVHAG